MVQKTDNGMVETTDNKGRTHIKFDNGMSIVIESDECVESPNNMHDGTTVVGWHRQFSPDLPKHLRHVNGEWAQEQDEDPDSDYKVFWLEAYIHGGVSLSLNSQGNFPDRRWDVSSNVGVILVRKADFSDYTDEQFLKVAKSIIKEWNQYLEGDVWGYVVKSPFDEIVDSCGGYYGMEDVKEQAISAANALYETHKEEWDQQQEDEYTISTANTAIIMERLEKFAEVAEWMAAYRRLHA